MPSRKRAQKKRLIVAMTGATGSIYGVRILETLRSLGGWETHLVVSDAGALNAWYDHKLTRKDLAKLADVVHNVRDVGASIASGSFVTHGMVLRDGRVLAQGPLASVLTAEILTAAFGAPCRIESEPETLHEGEGRRYRLWARARS